MRIAIYHNLPSGGAKRALYEWTRRLSISHAIDVYSLGTADHAFCDIAPFVDRYYISDFTPHRLFERPWGRLNRLQRWLDLGELTRIGRRIARLVNAGGYDLVFAHPCVFTLIPAFIRFLHPPSVYYLHEPFGPGFERQISRPYLKHSTKWRETSKQLDPLFQLYKHRLDKIRLQSMRHTSLLLANSRFTQERIKLEYGSDAPVCYCGVDTETFRPLPDIEKGNFVISVGELTPRKGFDFLIESLALIAPDRRPALRLACNWASPEERHYVEVLAAQHGVNLEIRVGLDSEELIVEYNRAQLCAYAPVLEPLGLVPLESMACGIPVVGVTEGGVSETVRHGETGLLTDRDTHRFADALANLLSDPDRRKQLGHQGRVYVEKEWQWDRSALDLETHLGSVTD